MEESGRKKDGLAAGWILVAGLLTLCLLGTGLTWWNYTRHVFSSAHGVIIRHSSPALLVAVDFPSRAAGLIRIGHEAIVTVDDHSPVLKGRGEVESVSSGKTDKKTIVIIRLGGSMSFPNTADLRQRKPDHFAPLLLGEKCSVTIDTTVPPMEPMEEHKEAGASQGASTKATP